MQGAATFESAEFQRWYLIPASPVCGRLCSEEYHCSDERDLFDEAVRIRMRKITVDYEVDRKEVAQDPRVEYARGSEYVSLSERASSIAAAKSNCSRSLCVTDVLQQEQSLTIDRTYMPTESSSTRSTATIPYLIGMVLEHGVHRAPLMLGKQI